MTGFNLPDGINENMIPGNRDIDIFVDRFIDRYCSEHCLGRNYLKCDGDAISCPEKVIAKAEKAYLNRYDEPTERED